MKKEIRLVKLNYNTENLDGLSREFLTHRVKFLEASITRRFNLEKELRDHVAILKSLVVSAGREGLDDRTYSLMFREFKSIENNFDSIEWSHRDDDRELQLSLMQEHDKTHTN